MLRSCDVVAKWVRPEVCHASVTSSAVSLRLAGLHAKTLIEIEANAHAKIGAADDFTGLNRAIAFWHGTFAVHLRTAVCIDLTGITDNRLAPCSKE